MLYSPTGHIAFAAYPKTASTSVASWFKERYPDACYVDPRRPHMPVHRALVEMGLSLGFTRGPRLINDSLRGLEKGLRALRFPSARCDLRVIGVVRDPFEMLVSLYKYWRRTVAPATATHHFIRAAIHGSFRDFFTVAILHRRLPTYDRFFDFRGPAWGGTRLISLDQLDAGLAGVSREFGIRSAGMPLQFMNADPTGRSRLDDYRRDVEDLLPALSARFRWYYDTFETTTAASPERRLLQAA